MSISSASFTPSFGAGAIAPASSTHDGVSTDPSIDQPDAGHFDRLVQHLADDGDDDAGADRPARSKAPSADTNSTSTVQSSQSDTPHASRARKPRPARDEGQSAGNDRVDQNAAAAAAAAASAGAAVASDQDRRLTPAGTRGGQPGTDPANGASTTTSTTENDQTQTARAQPSGAAASGTWRAAGAASWAKANGAVDAAAGRMATGDARGSKEVTAADAADAQTASNTASSLSFAARARAAFGAPAGDKTGSSSGNRPTDVDGVDPRDARAAAAAGSGQVADASSDGTNGGTTGSAGGDGRGAFDRTWLADATPDARPSADGAATFRVTPTLPMTGGSTLVGSAAPTASTGGAAAPQLTDRDGAGAALQIVQTMKVLTLQDGGVATVTLEPKYLGAVTVSVKVDSDTVSASVHADSPAVREWLRSNESVLRDSLGDQGLKLDRLEVAEPAQTPRRDADSGSSSSSSPEEQQRPPQSRPDPDGVESAFEVVV